MSRLLSLLDCYHQSSGVSTDTRSLRSGELFFALRGPNFNGNAYAKRAIESGASFAVVDDKELAATGERYVWVADTLLALQELAAAYRAAWTCPVIGLTGSNGKTTTKELLACVLDASYTVHYTAGNLNNHIGVPLTLLRKPENADMVVVEMGANHQGEIDELCRIARPTHGLITNIGRAHLEGFGGLEGVLQGKTELYRYLAETGGTAFVDVIDSVLRNAAQQYLEEGRIVGYASGEQQGKSKERILVAGELQREFPDVYARIYSDDTSVELNLPLPGRYNYKNALAALTVGSYFGIAVNRGCKTLESYRADNARSELRHWAGALVLLDAYNANPDSMREALRWLVRQEGNGRLAVLGELREMGTHSKEVHRELIRGVEAAGLDALYFGASFSGLVPDGQVAENITDLKKRVKAWIGQQKGNGTPAILIKGSRSNALERLVEDEQTA